MKKSRIFALILLVLLCFSGCSSGPPEEEAPNVVAEEPVEQEEPKVEPAELVEDVVEPEEASPLDLLGSIQSKIFDTLVVETEIYGPEGFISKSIVYQKGGNARTEIELPDGQKQIVILRAEEGITYQYAFGSKQGMKIVHGNAEAVMDRVQAMGGKMEMPNLRDVRNRLDEHMVVRKEELNGEKAIYIEFNDLHQNVEQAVVKMWYSEEYAYPIRYELFVNGELMMRSDVTKLEVNIDLDDSLFMPPEDVVFIELPLEGEFEMPQMPDMPDDDE